MSSTQAPKTPVKSHTKRDNDYVEGNEKHPKTAKINTKEEALIAELTQYYGVEYTGKDHTKFIKELVKSANHKVNQDDVEDQQREQSMQDKIGQLRMLWAEPSLDEKVKGDTAEQAAIRKAVHKEDIGVAIAFPDEDTYLLTNGGKEDSGNVNQDVSAIVSAAHRLAGEE